MYFSKKALILFAFLNFLMLVAGCACLYVTKLNFVVLVCVAVLSLLVFINMVSIMKNWKRHL